MGQTQTIEYQVLAIIMRSGNICVEGYVDMLSTITDTVNVQAVVASAAQNNENVRTNRCNRYLESQT